ncbi:hypothetical protein EST38_g2483 [Candolleomyces aberdarensis]|uniref:Sacsin/Nov domain-containing protein n=1 Tax=Candolleomyces aberdarensis TaxID=2316362 RepID=A0A4Q2DVV8_9AGAR|nr:hypothetical protein EST38_g2483 [Candolleomyces aberdarensis]
MSLRDALWDSGHDETVEVNQRALIDKVLARYSGEFTVFRELLQNSDDARSEEVEIIFETQPEGKETEGNQHDASKPLPDLKTVLVHKWKFRNNGILFRDEDWSRLKKIAEGNPDEEKIGAFGVGFYSLFSVTDDPFVTSGEQWMAFYWKDKKDQLYARRGKLPPAPEANVWTSFEMPLREPAPIPTPFDLIRFLTSSITFMTHLNRVSVFLDDKRLAKLEKTADAPRLLSVPKGLNPRTEGGMMTIANIRSTPVHIRAEVLKWVYSLGSEKKRILPVINVPKPSIGGLFSSFISSFSGGSTPQRTVTPLPPPEEPKPDLLAINDSAVSLTVYTADVTTKLDKKFSAALHRSTKKEPPSKLRYELIYTGKRQYDASIQEDSKYPSSTGSVFQGLRADLEGMGATRVFIGHSTAQTTGIGGHMASRFIPTVEREAIDFMDRNIAVWNRELVRVGGILARSAYEYELQDIKTSWAALKPDSSDAPSEERKALVQQAIHALKFFTFHNSTPSEEVSQILEAAYFSASAAFPIISSRGIMNCSEIRMPEPSLSSFVKDLPVVPQEVISDAGNMLTALETRGYIKTITISDVLKELNSRPLATAEMVAFLKWWTKVNSDPNLAPKDQQRLPSVQATLVNAAILAGEGDTLTQLSSIKTFTTSRTIIPVPPQGPLPNHVLPNAVSKELDQTTLVSIFGWHELTVVEWVTYICSLGGKAGSTEHDINLNPQWSERVLLVLARGWPSLSDPDKEKICASLRDKTCIPTSNGMTTPDQAYFPNVNVFQDLSVVSLPSGGPVRGHTERLLQALGVRKHVELQVLFNRMIKTSQWTVADLIKYLSSVRSTLSSEELMRLKNTVAFSKESTAGEQAQGAPSRYQARQLYEPLDVFRSLNLPVLDWGQKVKWRGSSDEAKLLFELGLQRYPPLGTIITLCTDQNPQIRTTALRYFLDNITTKYEQYDANDFANLAYIPALRNSEACLAKPKEVYSNAQWAGLNFLVLDPKHQKDASKLQVAAHPSPHQLVQLLRILPPKDAAEAERWFTVISTRLSEFSKAHLQELSDTRFVPTKSGHLSPNQCYIGAQSSNSVHSSLFTFVNFGNVANSFLMACGARQEPSIEEIAKILLEDPARYYKLCGEPDRYLQELRNLAVNMKLIPSYTLMRMKRSPMLLATQYKPKLDTKGDDLDDEEWDPTYGLKRAEEIVLVDDTSAYQIFKGVLWTAPQEDLIEILYQSLGSRKLSMHVEEEYQCTAEIPHSKKAMEVRELVLERLPLFLYEHTHSSKTRISMSWLSSGQNFIAKTFGKISVVTQLRFADQRISKSRETSAIARRVKSGPIQLWIAGNSQTDMYDVATSLTKQLFDNPKANDALLLMTILSTDLRSLKRRGYNISRILKQREAALPPSVTPTELPQDPSRGKESTPLPVSAQPPPLPPKPGARSLSQFDPRGMASDLMNRAGLGPSGTSTDSRTGPATVPGTQLQVAPPSGPQSRVSTPKPTSATPTNVISHNIDLAVKACRQESGNVLQNRQSMQEVRETMNESYCDVSGTAENLKFAGELENVKIYIADDVSLGIAKTFIRDNQDALVRFVRILKPLARVYELPQSTLHIFYDATGGLIAFNRNASLFVNFRFYQSWHDAEVRNGQLNSAYISWYFTLAHEIAHNLVQPHNSEHEFYFSAICEKYLMLLGKLLISG